jgi:hypothetical protein
VEKVFGTGRLKNIAFSLAFIIIWAGIALINIAWPNQEFSQAENRSLAAFPQYSLRRLLDGDFMNDMNDYLNDHFIGRQHWVASDSLKEYVLGKREISQVYIGRNALYRHYSNEGMGITLGNIAGVNAFAEKYDMPIYFMLVPSSTYVQQEKLPWLAPVWDEKGYIEATYAALDEGIKSIDVLSALALKWDNDIYYRTDHHWTGYGAYLGYLQLARAMGLPDRSPEIEISTVDESFLGTNHSRTGFPLVSPDTIELYQIGRAESFETYGQADGKYITTQHESMFFPEFLQQKDKYAFFLGRLQPYVTIYTGSSTGKKLLIFKDSYAHCLAPMLLEDYSEIRLVDLRSLVADDHGALIEAQRYDEALFLYSTDTFSQQMGPDRLAR